MNGKKITATNYLIVAILTIVSLLATYCARNYYIKQQLYQNENNYVMNFLSAIKPEEIDNYIAENHDIMIYISNSEIDNSEIQDRAKKIITKNEYSKDILYFDTKNLDDNFLDSFIEKYGNVNIQIVPDCLVIIKDGKIKDILNLSKENISALNKFIEMSYYR